MQTKRKDVLCRIDSNLYNGFYVDRYCGTRRVAATVSRLVDDNKKWTLFVEAST
jgi:hypothetical protein